MILACIYYSRTEEVI